MINPFFDEESYSLIDDDSDKLPHINQTGKFQFVTFRMADSLPQDRIKEIERIRNLY